MAKKAKPKAKSKGASMASKRTIKATGGENSGSEISMGRFGTGKLMDRGIQK